MKWFTQRGWVAKTLIVLAGAFVVLTVLGTAVSWH
jgi:hypothetical protein